MGVKRKTYRLKKGKIIDIEEYHDGDYGAPGKKRIKKEKPTKEQMRKVNAANKARRTRQKLLQYFNENDIFATLTYNVKDRPASMAVALDDFKKTIRVVRNEYKKRGRELFWIRNIERGTKGAWHIHLIVNEIGDTASILQKAWKRGGVYSVAICQSGKFYDEDFTKLANYITKDEFTKVPNDDGTIAKPRIKEANYNTSRNMPLPEPKVDKLVRWKEEPKPKKGYYIAKIYEGVNPVTNYKYRRYTMIKLETPEKSKKVKRKRE